SYTYDTLCEIKEQYPGDELFFIVGSDMLLSFNRWYKSEEILEMITLCAADREDDGVDLELPEFLKDKRVIITKLPPFELSSTHIRECISKGESTQGLLDEAVRFYIDEKGLYR
ncbi:MAG: nicotinate-nicotinamide nucleotide adenylyltransferase, partial [Clostridia bacterium]|nr:nicotinate-nicotinamide nucleotide adenylyltransferase [Clostridia bacterium]